jgi:hypothetical protein
MHCIHFYNLRSDDLPISWPISVKYRILQIFHTQNELLYLLLEHFAGEQILINKLDFELKLRINYNVHIRTDELIFQQA